MRYCSECKKEKEESYCSFCKKDTSNHFVMECLAGNYKVRMPVLSMKHKRPGIKDFLKKVYAGFQSSTNTIKHPDGVNISRVIDKEHNQYDETITDYKTGEIIRDIHEPLDQHIPSKQKRNT
jgi:hypothetical protein